LQAGSYTDAYISNKDGIKEFRMNVAEELSRIIHKLCPDVESILEAGIGEGDAMEDLLGHFNNEVKFSGFDISWSRVAYARMRLNKKRYENMELFTGDLLNIPCAENSFDIVYTSHAIEPNRGNEDNIIRELYRVARKYLITIEPSYELASDQIKKRMDTLGYVRKLESIAKENKYNVIEYKSFRTFNPQNPSAIMIIEKGGSPIHNFRIACPQFKSKLENIEGALYSKEGMMVYPIIDGIPCLRIENGIIASKYELFAKK
jgi:ubiquinone/menaquinone biosynthesis C-methylase UbiE/uncharacterized protein YbaR (Trm112 family)